MLSQKEIQEYKKNAQEIKVNAGDDIGEILKKLEELKKDGKYNYYVNIYGKTVYSVDIDYKKDFKRIVGMSEEEVKERIERAKIEDEIKQTEIEVDAKILLDYRKIAGKKQIEPAKHEIWEELVEKYSKPPYFTDAIDSIIYYLELLNSNFTLEEVIDKLNEQYGKLGDWYTSAILSYLSKFHRRGIALFELIRDFAKEDGNEIAEDNGYFDNLRKINEFIDLGCSYEEAELLSKIQPANINISLIDHPILISNDIIMGIKPDYFILGSRIGEDIALYMIEGKKVNSYMSVDGKTIDKYIDGTIGKTTSNKLEIQYTTKSAEQVKEEYEKIMVSYNQQDIATIIEVLRELNELSLEIPISETETIPAIKAIFEKYSKDVIKLIKSTK